VLEAQAPEKEVTHALQKRTSEKRPAQASLPETQGQQMPCVGDGVQAFAQARSAHVREPWRQTRPS
jgi:hypothetical protein